MQKIQKEEQDDSKERSGDSEDRNVSTVKGNRHVTKEEK